MASELPGATAGSGLSVCVFCGSSNGARPDYVQSAEAFGKLMAAEGVRLVYGGGGIGLMGASARSVNANGGKVLGVMPDFLRRHEVLYDEVETVVVSNMHERKIRMFNESDAFVVLPGGIGTLEEVVELMSWRRLDLHRKPIVFLNLDGFWDPFFAMMKFIIDEKFTPAWMPDTWSSVATVEELLPTIRQMRDNAASGPGFHGYSEAVTQKM